MSNVNLCDFFSVFGGLLASSLDGRSSAWVRSFSPVFEACFKLPAARTWTQAAKASLERWKRTRMRRKMKMKRGGTPPTCSSSRPNRTGRTSVSSFLGETQTVETLCQASPSLEMKADSWSSEETVSQRFSLMDHLLSTVSSF